MLRAVGRLTRWFEPETPCSTFLVTRVDADAKTFAEIRWDRERLLAAVAYYAEAAGSTPAHFAAGLQEHLDGRVAYMARAVARHEGEVAAVGRRIDKDRARWATAALMPPERVADLVIKVERHLNNQLNNALRELERLQDRRDGRAAPIADVRLSITDG